MTFPCFCGRQACREPLRSVRNVHRVGVFDPTDGATGTKYVLLNDGAGVSFTCSAIPSAATPVVACVPGVGAPCEVEWD